MKIWRKSSKGVIEDGVKVVDPIIKDVKATSCILFHDMITSDWAYCDVWSSKVLPDNRLLLLCKKQ